MKDADSLLAELEPPPLASVQAAVGDPPPPEMPSRSPHSHVHSIPHEGFPENPMGAHIKILLMIRRVSYRKTPRHRSKQNRGEVYKNLLGNITI